MIRKQYQKLMAIMYDPYMKGLEKVLVNYRTELLQQTYGTVLEVGAGTGVNFSLYPENVKVVSIEPSTSMYKKAVERAKDYPNISVYNIGIEDLKTLKDIPGQFDFITSMLVLCTIKDEQNAVRLYHRFLKDDGKLLVLEHIHSTGSFLGSVQKIVNPVWRPFADGCNLTRRQDKTLKNNGFDALSQKYFKLGTNWYFAVMKKQKDYVIL